MRGRIDQNGVLFIERGKAGWVPQVCVDAFQDKNMEPDNPRVCWHHCPFFREPVAAKEESHITNSIVETGKRVVYLCRGPLVFDVLEDKRMARK